MDLNTPPNPLSQIPSDAPLTKEHRHREYFYLAIAVILIAAGLIWWQIGKLTDESAIVIPTPRPTPEAQTEINNISQDVQAVDMGNLNADFQQIDNDLNSL